MPRFAVKALGKQEYNQIGQMGGSTVIKYVAKFVL